jgi:hypothetical protein
MIAELVCQNSLEDMTFGRAMVTTFALFCSSQMCLIVLTVCACKSPDIDATLSQDFKNGMPAN